MTTSKFDKTKKRPLHELESPSSIKMETPEVLSYSEARIVNASSISHSIEGDTYN